jgi:hypothetical protein
VRKDVLKSGRQVLDAVMTSYSWGSPPHEAQEIARKVETFLTNRGFIVWERRGIMLIFLVLVKP